MRGIASTFLLLCAPSLFALNSRSAVSVAGLDTNPCTVTSPCRSFTAAIAQTSSGGEIIALDSAGYGAFVLTVPLAISGAPGVHAAISVTGSTGIDVSAGLSDKVVLRNLVLIAAGGTGGIVDNGSRELTVIGCLIRGFTGSAILVSSGAQHLSVRNCTIVDNPGTGVNVGSGGFPHNVLVADSLITGGGGSGVHSDVGDDVVVSDCTISGNAGSGVEASTSAAGVALLTVKRSTLVHNSSGVAAVLLGQGNGAIASLSQNVIAFNGYGVLNFGGTANTFQNNRFAYNNVDVFGTAMTPTPLQ